MHLRESTALAILMAGLALPVSAQENYYPRGPWLVALNATVKCEAASGRTFVFDARAINRVKIITNDRGPVEDDVFWKIEYAGGVCYFPSSADQDRKVLGYFQKMKGFDNEAVIKAMESTANAVFLVWQK